MGAWERLLTLVDGQDMARKSLFLTKDLIARRILSTNVFLVLSVRGLVSLEFLSRDECAATAFVRALELSDGRMRRFHVGLEVGVLQVVFVAAIDLTFEGPLVGVRSFVFCQTNCGQS